MAPVGFQVYVEVEGDGSDGSKQRVCMNYFQSRSHQLHPFTSIIITSHAMKLVVPTSHAYDGFAIAQIQGNVYYMQFFDLFHILCVSTDIPT